MTASVNTPPSTPFVLPYGAQSVSIRIKSGLPLVGEPPPAPTQAPTWPDLARRAREAIAPALTGADPHLCLIVPDRTRNAGTGAFAAALLASLPSTARVSMLFASGTHAPMSEAEMRAAAGAAANDARVRLVAHDCDAPAVALPSTVPQPAPARVNPVALNADARVVLSRMSFHYLAGFGGGRKMLLPGVADRSTATAVHATCIDDTGRPAQIAAGVLEENPFHQAIAERLEGALGCTVGVAVDLDGDALVDAEVGELFAHHSALAARFAAHRRAVAPHALSGLVVGAGGMPYDGNLVQSHKALNAVSSVLAPGARVALVAEMGRGYGHADFRRWVAEGDAASQHRRLVENFNIGRQTAWSLRRLLDEHDVGILSALPAEDVRTLGATPLADAAAAEAFMSACDVVGVAPRGAQLLYSVGSSAWELSRS